MADRRDKLNGEWMCCGNCRRRVRPDNTRQTSESSGDDGICGDGRNFKRGHVVRFNESCDYFELRTR
jgi:hypothetical protein